MFPSRFERKTECLECSVCSLSDWRSVSALPNKGVPNARVATAARIPTVGMDMSAKDTTAAMAATTRPAEAPAAAAWCIRPAAIATRTAEPPIADRPAARAIRTAEPPIAVRPAAIAWSIPPAAIARTVEALADRPIAARPIAVRLAGLRPAARLVGVRIAAEGWCITAAGTTDTPALAARALPRRA
jgi:hypothetical protein